MARQLGLTKTDWLMVFTYFALPILVLPILLYQLWKSAAGRLSERKNHQAADNPPSDSL